MLRAKDKEAQKDFQKSKEMFLFIGHLKASIEMYERQKSGSALSIRIEEIVAESFKLNAAIDSKRIAAKVKQATAEICQNALSYLRVLDAEKKYTRVAPQLSVKNLAVSVLSDDGNWHPLSEVGSASNWVSFHLSIMCGIQEYFSSMPGSVVPSFVIFDQPSQVYFPSLGRIKESEADPKFRDEDVIAVRAMFQTLSESIKKCNGFWQAIVLDHAASDVYG